MAKKNTTDATCVVTPGLAAQHLYMQLGDSPEAWALRLANWRKPDRKAVIPFVKSGAGNPGYEPDALDAFVADQLEKRSFVAKARDDAPLKVAAKAHFDDPNMRPHVRLLARIAGVTQSDFVLTADQARQLASMLTKSADVIARLTPVHEGGTA